LAAIDFQPTSGDRSFFESKNYICISKKHEKWRDVFPSGGDLPEDAKRYFSPYALWTRIPPSKDPSMQVTSTPLMVSVGQALDDYVGCYAELIKEEELDRRTRTGSKVGSSDDDSDQSRLQANAQKEQFLTEYLDYRIEKDPAKRLLQSSFGADWTSRVLKEVLFPKL
jgi:phycoerythrobilin:ferredoxin oxidoreductase